MIDESESLLAKLCLVASDAAYRRLASAKGVLKGPGSNCSDLAALTETPI